MKKNGIFVKAMALFLAALMAAGTIFMVISFVMN